MGNPLCLAALGECSLSPLYHPPDRSYPRTWRTATLAAEERTEVRQDGIGQVEYRLKWAKSKDTKGEGPGKPLSAGQVPQAIDVFNRRLFEHHEYIRQHLEDMPDIRNWHWTADFSEPSAPPPLAKGHPRAALFTNS
jgi:hypothetical protein